MVESHEKELDTLKKTTVPNLQDVVQSHKNELDTLKHTTIPNLQNELYTLNMTTVPNLQRLMESHKKQLDSLREIIIPNLSNVVESQKIELNNLKSNPVPIGFIYVQLSGQSEPKTLWPNTEWQNISPKYSGLFFRAEGGQSSPFGQTQEQLTQSIDLQSTGIGHRFNVDYTHGPIKVSNNYQLPIFTGSPNVDWYGILIKHNSEEVRPRNQAVRIWQRIK